jgi:imidazole glycerol-phosphate synthase subunit HisH
MIVIADYGVGNLQSVERMLRKAGANAKLSNDPIEIREADKLILPGVGNFGHCATELRAARFYDTLQWFALEAKRPVLGICVGAQLLGHSSDEAEGAQGLGWIDMVCRRFPDQPGLRVPNMGWNTISPLRPSPLFAELDEESRFYFVHSYYFDVADEERVLAVAEYGFPYACAVNRENITGVQFHPEKSLRHGQAVLKAFANS